MKEPTRIGARAAAVRLAAEHGAQLPTDVERAIHLRDNPQPPDQYVDPVALGALIVSIANLAWTMYTDLRAKTLSPSTAVIARTIRVQLDDPSHLSTDQRDRIIDVTVEETVRAISEEN